MRKLLATTLVGLAVLALVPAAFAKDGVMSVRGTCTGGSTAKLKLSPDDGRIEVEFEVDQNRNGVAWNVTLKRNGARFFQGTRRTVAPSGSFEVRRLVTNHAGSDTIVAKATRAGETCTARGTI